MRSIGPLRRHVQVDDDVGLAHEVAHVAEQLDVGAVVALVHEPRLGQHLGEHRVLVDGAVLDRGALPPDDLLMLLEALVEQVDLGGEGVALGVAVEILEVLVVLHRLVVDVDPQVLPQAVARVDFPAPIIPAIPIKRFSNLSMARRISRKPLLLQGVLEVPPTSVWFQVPVLKSDGRI